MSSSQIENLREEIQEINKEIIQLIACRVETAEQIGERKKNQGMQVHQPNQEKQVLQSCREHAQDNALNQEAIEAIFRQIIKLSRERQRDM